MGRPARPGMPMPHTQRLPWEDLLAMNWRLVANQAIDRTPTFWQYSKRTDGGLLH